MSKPDRLFPEVCEILFREWDPIGVNGNELCSDEYDSYARTICRYLKEGADEFKLTEYLKNIARGFGPSALDDERDRKVARHLLSLIGRYK